MHILELELLELPLLIIAYLPWCKLTCTCRTSYSEQVRLLANILLLYPDRGMLCPVSPPPAHPSSLLIRFWALRCPTVLRTHFRYSYSEMLFESHDPSTSASCMELH